MLLLLARTIAIRAFGVVKPFTISRRVSFTHRLAAAKSKENETTTPKQEQQDNGKIPIHLLAGFLGSGKTTTLKNLLENTEDMEIGVIVNGESQCLVRTLCIEQSNLTIRLDVASVNIDAKLVNNNNKDSSNNGVVELQNGCACCSLADELLASLENLLETKTFDAIVVELSGVADPVAIQNNWKQAIQSNKQVTQVASLQNVVTLVDACTFGTDYLTWDVAKDRWENSNNRQVVELLAEQVEAAHVVILNKQDMASDAELEVATKMCKSLNQDAAILTTSFGKVSASKILQLASSMNAAAAAEETEAEHDEACDDPDGMDTSHSHSHDHDEAACADPDCTDSSHSHSHDHAVAACDDPDCTDTSHDHSHDHATTNVDSLGISNFVYTATRPFHAQRLSEILFAWPIPNKDELDLVELLDKEAHFYKDGDESSPFVGVLRSKGFCWLAPTNWDGMLSDSWRHNTAMYWSHAGKHLGVQPAGRWWDSVDQEVMKEFFGDNINEYERVLAEDFVTKEYGDRRQELVFIGVDLQEDKIREALDECLLSDDEMKDYREQVAKLEQLMREQREQEEQQDGKETVEA